MDLQQREKLGIPKSQSLRSVPRRPDESLSLAVCARLYAQCVTSSIPPTNSIYFVQDFGIDLGPKTTQINGASLSNPHRYPYQRPMLGDVNHLSQLIQVTCPRRSAPVGQDMPYRPQGGVVSRLVGTTRYEQG
jgi:hypothetical protein